MNFPAYVPAAVREFITSMLEGNQWREFPCMAAEVDCLRRLGHDPHMQGAFAILTSEFAEDWQWQEFIRAAWVAHSDYKIYRDRISQAARLQNEIAGAAGSLAKLIRQFSDLGIDNGPGEFYSIPALLRKTNGIGRNLYMWPGMRRVILGELPPAEPAPTEQAAIPALSIRFVKPGDPIDLDPKEAARNSLRYAWESAPDVPAMLDAMASIARAFKLSDGTAADAALASRQANQKTEYLRAFGALLAENDFTLSPRIMRAMAFVADVAINDPDIHVSYDDVRKALKAIR